MDYKIAIGCRVAGKLRRGNPLKFREKPFQRPDLVGDVCQRVIFKLCIVLVKTRARALGRVVVVIIIEVLVDEPVESQPVKSSGQPLTRTRRAVQENCTSYLNVAQSHAVFAGTCGFLRPHASSNLPQKRARKDGKRIRRCEKNRVYLSVTIAALKHARRMAEQPFRPLSRYAPTPFPAM